MEATATQALAEVARSGSVGPRGTYEKVIQTEKEARSGPLRPYLEAYVARFNKGTPHDELLEKMDAVYDKRALVFSNNFITSIGGTENAVAVWRYMVAPMKKIDLQIKGIKVRYTPPEGPAGRDAGERGRGALLELQLDSEQRWHLPTLLVLVRWVFGNMLCVRVTTTMTVDASSGRVVHQRDAVHNWLMVPLPLRVALGLWVPLLTTVLRP